MKTLYGALVLSFALVGAAAPARAQESKNATTVTVQNNYHEPVTVFVEYGPFDRRIGEVKALSEATLPLPPSILRQNGEIQVFVHLARGGDQASQWFHAAPGEQIAMIVPTATPASNEIVAPLPPEDLSKTTLTVINDRPRSVVIFAQEGDGPFEVRLGKVAAEDTATLRFPRSVVRNDQTVQIDVQAAGGLDLESQEPLQLKPGEHLALRLTPATR